MRAGVLEITIPVRPVFRGGRTWLVAPDGQAALGRRAVDPVLVKGLRGAHGLQAEYSAAPLADLDVLRGVSSPDDSYRRRLMAIAFLAPDIQQAIVEGRQPAGLSLQKLPRMDLPLAWEDQRLALGF